MAKKSRDKGARGELEVRDVLREIGYDAHRGVQDRRGGDASDIENVPWHVEVKLRASTPNPYAAMRQARKESKGKPPLVFTRRTTGPLEEREWLVTMRAEDFKALALAARELKRLASDIPRIRAAVQSYPAPSGIGPWVVGKCGVCGGRAHRHPETDCQGPDHAQKA